MNQQPCFADLAGFAATPCPVADSLWKTGLYLPSSTELGEDSVRRIAGILAGLLGRA
jgi:perosamine synthetase